MTGYTTHTGPSQKFNDGWARVFGSGTNQPKAKSKKAAGESSAKSKPKNKKSS